ncbi:MAG: bacteriophage holin [Candidatus Margulisbacteria bacterium]|nr:bacteriophage holin [Candidatus Margulisiibacteriota bacterium]MBU1022194.1 bacteriophage holin [Candidatus Margulisiibacteriota bacterium]MBU1729367.1 bacteriophage holin [Candidatus Margulisiibacteriota bacterium]MBU1955640.1 bacteriophage holin [Candidatus Margulisiibacteriota bacterium]
MKLDALKFGLACGIIWAACVLCLGAMGGIFDWGMGLVKGLGTLYLGYKPTVGGIAIGTVWAFFDAGIGGLILAGLYNLLVGKK